MHSLGTGNARRCPSSMDDAPPIFSFSRLLHPRHGGSTRKLTPGRIRIRTSVFRAPPPAAYSHIVCAPTFRPASCPFRRLSMRLIRRRSHARHMCLADFVSGLLACTAGARTNGFGRRGGPGGSGWRERHTDDGGSAERCVGGMYGLEPADEELQQTRCSPRNFDGIYYPRVLSRFRDRPAHPLHLATRTLDIPCPLSQPNLTSSCIASCRPTPSSPARTGRGSTPST